MNLEQAIAHREAGRFDKSIQGIQQLLERTPQACELHYQMGWAHDAADLSHLSIAHYRRALELGLSGEDRVGCFVALGSSLRAVGEYAQAKEVFLQAIEEFPDRNNWMPFYAMTLYNLGESKEACRMLASLVAETSSDPGIQPYSRAIASYAEDLDATYGEVQGIKTPPQHMLHHLSIPTTDLDTAGAFYDAALAPLGYERVWSDRTAIGYGRCGAGDKLAIKLKDAVPGPTPGLHLAFAAESPKAVDRFYAEARRLGGGCLGEPGLRPQYGPSYYAAFIASPDGFHLEAVSKG